jgi:hypothetical protein
MDLEIAKATPLSDLDIMKKLNGQTNIVMYSELKNVRNIEQILKDNSVVILYETGPKIGHWVCLIRYFNTKRKQWTIEFFDSYGIFPDEEKKQMNQEYLKESGTEYNKIAKLLVDASDRYVIEFNNYRLQKKSKGISTCGRHVISRIKLKQMDIDEYSDLMRSFAGYTPDDIATIISEM